MSMPMDEFLKALERVDRLNAERARSESNAEPTPGTSSTINANNCSNPRGDGASVSTASNVGELTNGNGSSSIESGSGDGNRERDLTSNSMPGYTFNYNRNQARLPASPSENADQPSSTPVRIPHYQQTFPEFGLPSRYILEKYAIETLAWNQMGQTVSNREIGAIVSPLGFISIRCCPEIKIDIMPNRTLRVQHNGLRIIVALRGNNEQSAVVHPACTMYQYAKNVEAKIHKNFAGEDIKYIRVWRKGINFTFEGSSLTYLVDHVGIRSNKVDFSDLNGDVSKPVFSDPEHYMKPRSVKACMEMLRTGSYWMSPNNEKRIWKINEIKITYGMDGILKIDRHGSKSIQISPQDASVLLDTPMMTCQFSLGQNGNSDQVICKQKQGQKSFQWTESTLKVECGLYSAGIDPSKKFKIF